MTPRYELHDFSTASSDQIQDALERSAVVYFDRPPVELPSVADLDLLRSGLPQTLRTKNISYHPESDSVPKFDAPADVKNRVENILRNHGRRVEAWLQKMLPEYVPNWTLGTTSFRSMEEQGRDLAPRSSNERVHIDAGAYGATNGARILRFFVNVNLEQARVWGTKGSFHDVMANYEELWSAAHDGQSRINLQKRAKDRVFTGAVNLLSKAYPIAKVIDSSPYDRAMRRVHNQMKESDAFRNNLSDFKEIHFPPMSAWMVFTDGISHSVISGQHALVTTALIPLQNCRHQQLAPYYALQAHAEA